MKISSTEMDDTIFAYVNRQSVNLPKDYEEMVKQTLVQLNEKKGINKKNWQSRVAILVIVFVCIGGTGVYAGTNYVAKRQQELSKDSVEQYIEDVQNSNANADTFSRELSEEEKARYSELEVVYMEEGRFPKDEVLIIQSVEEINSERVCFLANTSTFYLPKHELNDEDLLEIIDFRYMRDYSLTQEANITTEELIEPKNDIGLEEMVVQLMAVLFDEERTDLNIESSELQNIQTGQNEQLQEYIKICNQADKTQYIVVYDTDENRITNISFEGKESNYADGMCRDAELEKTTLYDMAQMKNKVFTDEESLGDNCYVQTIVKEDTNCLQRGIINYCFELEHGMVSVISYSYVTETFYQYRLFTKESFEEWKNRHKEQCENDGFQFSYTEIK